MTYIQHPTLKRDRCTSPTSHEERRETSMGFVRPRLLVTGVYRDLKNALFNLALKILEPRRRSHNICRICYRI